MQESIEISQTIKLHELATLGAKLVNKLGPDPPRGKGPQGKTKGVSNNVLDVSDDDIEKVLNSLGDNDVELNILESELASLKYMLIQFDNIPPEFSVNMGFIVPSIFKDSLGQLHSFEEDFEKDVDTHRPLIAEVDNSHSKEEANNRVRCHTWNTKDEISNTLEGVDG